jgi:hypothetical protein
MVSFQWKQLERLVAKALQGHRIPRGANFSRSLPDVIADSSKTLARSNGLIFAECKYSQYQPWVELIRDQYTGKLIRVKTKDDSLIFFELNDVHLLSDPSRYSRACEYSKQVPAYLIDNLQQSRDYIDIVRKDLIMSASVYQLTAINIDNPILPIVVMAHKGKSFRVAYTSVKDLMAFYTLQHDQSYRVFPSGI